MAKKLSKKDRRHLYECAIELFKNKKWIRDELFGNSKGGGLYVKIKDPYGDYADQLSTVKDVLKAGVEPRSFCLLGAASWCAGKDLSGLDLPELTEAARVISSRIREEDCGYYSITEFNDEVARSKKDIYKVLNDAIKLTEKSK